MRERLNKILARAGVASRRGSDQLIRDGRVQVNGRVVRELGTSIDPGRDAIKVDGKRIASSPRAHTYLMLNKPKGYLTTLSDPQDRPTIRDLLRGIRTRVYPVGRLDFHTEGLLLLTDDGDLARDLMHPGSGVTKTYAAKVRGTPSAQSLERLRRGVTLEGRRTLPARVSVTRAGRNSWLEIGIVEGRKHQVRKMLVAVGHPVLKLKRVRYDGLSLRGLAAGAVRPLTATELSLLRRAARGKTGRQRAGSRGHPNRRN